MLWMVIGLSLTLLIIECSSVVLDEVNRRVVSNYNTPWAERLHIIERNARWMWVVGLCILLLLWACIYHHSV